MIGLFTALVHAPARNHLIWDVDFPEARRASLAPQADVIQLAEPSSSQDHVLFLPPISGHSSTLVQDIAKPCQPHFNTHILHWQNPAYLGPDEADYGHETQVRITRQAIEACLADVPEGQTLHIAAICQAASPTIIALDGIDGKKVSLTLIAAPLVDTPGGVCDLFLDASTSAETLQQASSLTVPGFNGVSMLPAGTQLAAILNGPGGALRILQSAFTYESMPVFSGGSRDATLRRTSLLDARPIPEKLLLEGLISNFVERNHLSVQLDPEMPVHLVAGECDQVVPPEQTFGFSQHLQGNTVARTLFSGLDHFDLFASGTARHAVSQELKKFFEHPAGRPESKTV